MTRNATVPTGTSDGVADCTRAHAATTLNADASTGIGPIRSDSQPPTGRMTTATRTKPAILFAASVCARLYAFLR
jgi:hypothetical protein